MKRFVVFAMLLVVVSMSSCIKWKCCINGDFVQVYKSKSDYTNNAYVLYNKDKDYIYGYYDDRLLSSSRNVARCRVSFHQSKGIQ